MFLGCSDSEVLFKSLQVGLQGRDLRLLMNEKDVVSVVRWLGICLYSLGANFVRTSMLQVVIALDNPL